MSPGPFPLFQVVRDCVTRSFSVSIAVIDCQNAGAVNGAKAVLAPSEAKLMLRERWLLYVQCAESKVRKRDW